MKYLFFILFYLFLSYTQNNEENTKKFCTSNIKKQLTYKRNTFYVKILKNAFRDLVLKLYEHKDIDLKNKNIIEDVFLACYEYIGNPYKDQLKNFFSCLENFNISAKNFREGYENNKKYLTGISVAGSFLFFYTGFISLPVAGIVFLSSMYMVKEKFSIFYNGYKLYKACDFIFNLLNNKKLFFF